jgi:hypothetical protein
MKYSIFLDETEPGLSIEYSEYNDVQLKPEPPKKMEKKKQIEIIQNMNIHGLLKWIYLRQL